MKTKYIISIVVIAVAIGVILSMYGSTSSYVTFDQASLQEGKEVHVIGTLVTDSNMYYDPVKDPNHLEFYLGDSLNNVKKVIFHSPKPTDLERSEKVVIVGKMMNDEFHATGILLKCPSKYNDGKLEETEYNAVSWKK